MNTDLTILVAKSDRHDVFADEQAPYRSPWHGVKAKEEGSRCKIYKALR